MLNGRIVSLQYYILFHFIYNLALTSHPQIPPQQFG